MFKIYSSVFKRSKKNNIDVFKTINIDKITRYTKSDVLDKCQMLYQEKIKNPTDNIVDALYKKRKNSLPAINCHNNGDILNNEFKTTNYLVYDLDNLTPEQVTQIVNFSEDYSRMIMLSPSAHGVKLFFEFHENQITYQNFKILYKNFGDMYISKMNSTIRQDIEWDIY